MPIHQNHPVFPHFEFVESDERAQSNFQLAADQRNERKWVDYTRERSGAEILRTGKKGVCDCLVARNGIVEAVFEMRCRKHFYDPMFYDLSKWESLLRFAKSIDAPCYVFFLTNSRVIWCRVTSTEGLVIEDKKGCRGKTTPTLHLPLSMFHVLRLTPDGEGTDELPF